MLNLLLSLLGGVLGGLVGGRLSYWFTRRRWLARQPAPAMPPDMADQLDQAAQQWASAQGRPAAAPLLAGKLRLLYRLNQRRWSRW